MPKSPEERKAAISAAQVACRMAEEAAGEAREALWQAESEENKAAWAVRRAAERKVRDSKVSATIKADALALLAQIAAAEIKVRAARLRRDRARSQVPFSEAHEAHELVLKCRKERAALAEALSALETRSPESVEVAWEEWATIRARKDEAGGVEENP